MKELFYKDIAGNNPRKREVSMEEVTNSTKKLISRKWICKYFIRERYDAADAKDLRNWIAIKKRKGVRKDCHILRHFDTRTGENKIVCKVLGDIFAVCEKTVYKIVYINEIKIEVGSKKRIKRGIR